MSILSISSPTCDTDLIILYPGTYIRPGLFKCEGEENYLLASQVCDGQSQCKHGDDEQICEVYCPDDCDCVGFFYNCSQQNIQDDMVLTDISLSARKIDLSDNKLPQLFSILRPFF